MPGVRKALSTNLCFSLYSLHPVCSPFAAPAPLFSNGQAEGCYIPDDCHHRHLSVQPALTSQKGSEPASQAAWLWEQIQTAPCPLFASTCQAQFVQTLDFSPKKPVGCVFITWWEVVLSLPSFDGASSYIPVFLPVSYLTIYLHFLVFHTS